MHVAENYETEHCACPVFILFVHFKLQPMKALITHNLLASYN